MFEKNLDRKFKVVSPFEPCGDQGKAIEELSEGIKAGKKHQVLLGVTGSGKTFTIAKCIEKVQKPTLIICHNKTLAAQLYSEYKQFFPDAAVEYFVSYFDYYQPEAYIPSTDTYIEKDSSVNVEIERLRLSATNSLLTRRDVIVVASVSCIYGLGSPEDYESLCCQIEVGQSISRNQFLALLVEMLYERNDFQLTRGKFRVRGDVVEICHVSPDRGLRIEFFGNRIERITEFELQTGRSVCRLQKELIFPASHFVTTSEKLKRAIRSIRQELDERIAELESKGKLLEAQRLKLRTENDLEMLEELGFCNGIENYSRHLSGRAAGSAPYTLLDFFPQDFLTVIDESHATIPQIQGMYEGDMSRKRTLVEHGFRLPSALDNRPLSFSEFEAKIGQLIYVSATPGEYELRKTEGRVIEQIIRPTGLLDPEVEVRPLEGQIDDVIKESSLRIKEGQRVLVLTLTKQTAEDLSDYLRELGFKVRYLHSELDAIERVEILRELRSGGCDVLVGINLLREGLDLPEVSLVCILDADKEGYLRSEKSLIQIAGRAARHEKGKVILYADNLTQSIKKLIAVTNYRRNKQLKYNEQHGITPKSVRAKELVSLHGLIRAEEKEAFTFKDIQTKSDYMELIKELGAAMIEASAKLEFEKAALFRDQIEELKRRLKEGKEPSADFSFIPLGERKTKRKKKVLRGG
ncbi:excinuclease ABC subunit UvrB [Methylacidiphilum caldifontis]|uniref:UvrABC system protein B n=1 Tax=Methylacidiphilum caldifontis TaxID=2795386 RepID=A0A4Y8PFR2_9BACT|nr:excinuclease ABC subunit UvrB [Methylacidiphilum caldifontis]QSR88399.1 excinuclease ABC subunit UvrB [Methylacidiphilum caldifontis]TFE70697.1 excinuclease ABC subunit B [Methylacidiphilum caldifontis]